MNVFIIFVKFLGWIIAIWVRLTRLIGENGGLRLWKGAQMHIYIYIYIITIFKKKRPRGAWGPLPGFVLDPTSHALDT